MQEGQIPGDHAQDNMLAVGAVGGAEEVLPAVTSEPPSALEDEANPAEAAPGAQPTPPTEASPTPLQAPEISRPAHETKDTMLERLIISTAVKTYTEVKRLNKVSEKNGGSGVGQTMNQAEHSFSLLGHIVGNLRMYESLDQIGDMCAHPLAEFNTNFGPHEPKPRVLIQGNSQRAVFDNRDGGTGDTNPTTLAPGVFELQAVYAKIRERDGSVRYVCSANYNDQSGRTQTRLPVLVNEGVFIQSYMLAQHTIIQQGLTEYSKAEDAPDRKVGLTKGISDTDTGIRDAISIVTRNAGAFAPHSMDTRTPLDLTQDLTEERLNTLSAGIKITGSELTALAQRFKDNQLIDDAELLRINTYVEALSVGQGVSAENVLDVLCSAGSKGMRERIDAIDQEIRDIDAQLRKNSVSNRDALESNKRKLQQEKRIISKMVRRDMTDNPIYNLFRDMDEGRADPQTAQQILDKIKRIDSPADFFEMKAEDLQDPNSLISLITKHYLKAAGMDDTEQQAWMTKFLKEHGGDIGLMVIYVLLQTVAGIAQSAVKQ